MIRMLRHKKTKIQYQLFFLLPWRLIFFFTWINPRDDVCQKSTGNVEQDHDSKDGTDTQGAIGLRDPSAVLKLFAVFELTELHIQMGNTALESILNTFRTIQAVGCHFVCYSREKSEGWEKKRALKRSIKVPGGLLRLRLISGRRLNQMLLCLVSKAGPTLVMNASLPICLRSN